MTFLAVTDSVPLYYCLWSQRDTQSSEGDNIYDPHKTVLSILFLTFLVGKQEDKRFCTKQ